MSYLNGIQYGGPINVGKVHNERDGQFELQVFCSVNISWMY